jgi:hypothetical protein
MQRFPFPTEKLLSPVVMKMNAAMGAFRSRAIPYLVHDPCFGHLLDIRSKREAKLLKVLALPSGIEPLSPP